MPNVYITLTSLPGAPKILNESVPVGTKFKPRTAFIKKVASMINANDITNVHKEDGAKLLELNKCSVGVLTSFLRYFVKWLGCQITWRRLKEPDEAKVKVFKEAIESN
ncbi:hypothetical protein Tco_0245468 [Tanacetum coccineum]